MRLAGCVWSLAALLGCVGCGNEIPEGIPVAGTVSFDGSPLDQGAIEFSPLGAGGVFSGTQIVDGVYSIPAEKGLTPGTYEVRISSSSGGAAVEEEAPGESTITAQERIPAEFNTATKLKVDVKQEAENEFDFQIP